MFATVVKRIGAALVVMVVVTIVTFVALQVLPGDTATLILGQEATPERVAEMRASLGLDEPVWARYANWVAGVASGDWGVSRLYGRPVLDVVMSAFPMTVLLAVLSTALALAVSLVLGLAAARHPGSAVDVVARTLMQMASAAPAFWVAILLLLAFSDGLGWFPVSGYTPFSQDPLESLRSLTLPAVALAVGECGVLIRTVRASAIEAYSRGWTLSTEVKGLTRPRRTFIYVLRSALVAPLTVAGVQFAKLVGGTVAVESVFALPGLGRLLLVAVEQRDLMLVQGTVLVVTLLVVLATLVFDLAVMAADPQVRSQEAGEVL